MFEDFAIVAVLALLILAVGVLSLCLCDASGQIQDLKERRRADQHKLRTLKASMQALAINLGHRELAVALDDFLAAAERQGLVPLDERRAA